MSASQISLGVVIGGTVGATFGQAISNSIAKLVNFKQSADAVTGLEHKKPLTIIRL
jgi:hypothetical protein